MFSSWKVKETKRFHLFSGGMRVLVQTAAVVRPSIHPSPPPPAAFLPSFIAASILGSRQKLRPHTPSPQTSRHAPLRLTAVSAAQAGTSFSDTNSGHSAVEKQIPNPRKKLLSHHLNHPPRKLLSHHLNTEKC